MKKTPDEISHFSPLRQGICLSMALLLAACATPPDLGSKPQIKSIEQYGYKQSLDAATTEWASNVWWKSYSDEQLNQLIDEALKNAPDMAIAQARLLKAEGYAQQSGAALWPSVKGTISTSKLKTNGDDSAFKSIAPNGLNYTSAAILSFSYEIDFWGKNRASVAAATSERDAALADAAQAKLTLTTSIVAAYAELSRLYADLDTAQQAVQVRSQSDKLLTERQQQGLETMGSVKQAESRLASAQADLLEAQQAITLQRNQLAALAGAGPDRGLTIQRPAIQIQHGLGIPANLGANLLGRRPDVVAAKLKVEAADKRITVAKADFYPDVNLTAYAGKASLGTLDTISRSTLGLGMIGPAISLPIFKGGQLQGAYRVSRANYDEAVASYNQTIIQALHDVADALTRLKDLQPQLDQRKLALASAEEAYRVANNRYKGGLDNYLNVLNAEDTVINTRKAVADLQSQAFSLDVALIKALGGGYKQTN